MNQEDKDFVLEAIKINNESLLSRMDENFKKIAIRFDAVDKRFDAVDKRFDAVDKRFDAVDKRFDAVDKRFDVVEQRLERLENGQKINETYVRTLPSIFSMLEDDGRKIADLIDKVNTLISPPPQ